MTHLRILTASAVAFGAFLTGCQQASDEQPPQAAQAVPPPAAVPQAAVPAVPESEPAPAPAAAPQLAEAPDEEVAAEFEISDKVKPLMLRTVRPQRSRLWRLKENPKVLDAPNQWQTVTAAADKLDEVAGKIEDLAPEESEVWEDSIERLRKGTAALREAAGAENVNHFKGAIQTTWRSCNNCHSKYAPKAPMNKLEYASTGD